MAGDPSTSELEYIIPSAGSARGRVNIVDRENTGMSVRADTHCSAERVDAETFPFMGSSGAAVFLSVHGLEKSGETRCGRES